MFPFTARGSTLDAESDVYRRQILSSKVDPRAERVNRTFGLGQHWASHLV